MKYRCALFVVDDIEKVKIFMLKFSFSPSNMISKKMLPLPAGFEFTIKNTSRN